MDSILAVITAMNQVGIDCQGFSEVLQVTPTLGLDLG